MPLERALNSCIELTDFAAILTTRNWIASKKQLIIWRLKHLILVNLIIAIAIACQQLIKLAKTLTLKN
jgi:hypothetical protein